MSQPSGPSTQKQFVGNVLMFLIFVWLIAGVFEPAVNGTMWLVPGLAVAGIGLAFLLKWRDQVALNRQAEIEDPQWKVEQARLRCSRERFETVLSTPATGAEIADAVNYFLQTSDWGVGSRNSVTMLGDVIGGGDGRERRRKQMRTSIGSQTDAAAFSPILTRRP